MNKITIKVPIWKEPRSIGIAGWRLTGERIEIEIVYKNKEGERLYPERYYIDCDSARKYPAQVVSGTKLFVIPIKELGVIKEIEKEVEEDNADIDFDFSDYDDDLSEIEQLVREAPEGSIERMLKEKVLAIREKAKDKVKCLTKKGL